MSQQAAWLRVEKIGRHFLKNRPTAMASPGVPAFRRSL